MKTIDDKHVRVKIREVLDDLAIPVMSDKEGAESWIRAIDRFEKLMAAERLDELKKLPKSVVNDSGHGFDVIDYEDVNQRIAELEAKARGEGEG